VDVSGLDWLRRASAEAFRLLTGEREGGWRPAVDHSRGAENLIGWSQKDRPENVDKMENKIKPRVFLSCGQGDIDEQGIAKKIKETLEGYCKSQFFDKVYLADLERSQKGIIESIYRELQESEYVIFIDFKREEYVDSDGKKYNRGSLFANQEFAITSFLELPYLFFQEEGVKEGDGILSYIQGGLRPISFSFGDRKRLHEIVLEVVEKEVASKKWHTGWRNELCINQEDFKTYTDIWDQERSRNMADQTRYHHIKIHNCHRDKIARNCIVYLNKELDLDTGEEKKLDIVEIKWTSIRPREAFIPPTRPREFDLLRVVHKRDVVFPNGQSPEIKDTDKIAQRPQLRDYDIRYNFNREIVDSGRTREIYQIEKIPCRKRLFFSVFSDNFYPLEFRLDLEIKGDTFGGIGISL